MLYIKRIYLKNIRCFEELDIKFDKLGSSILIIGDNGDGKSTILRCLAIGLCDQSSAAALFRELQGEFVRHGKEKDGGTILIELGGKGGFTYKIVTHIRSGKVFERVEQELVRKRGKEVKKLTPDNFPWDRIFVSGYGAGGRTQGSADFQHYRAVDAVYSLFRYDEPLQNPELVIRRLMDNVRLTSMARLGATAPQFHKDKVFRGKPLPRFMEAHEASLRMLEDVQKLLTFILDIGEDERIQLGYAAIELVGPDGKVELGALGDGYRATVTWVLDLLSWWLLREGGQSEKSEWYREITSGQSEKSDWYRDITRLDGIVIVDEIEQHLHPRWQRYILTLLKKSFPSIQFVTTTHSPLCASGTADLGDNTWQLLRLVKEKEASEAERISLPRGLRADQILTSEAFGLPETRNPVIGEKVAQYYKLLLKSKLTNNEKSDLKMLQKFITKNVPEAGQFEVERKMRDELQIMIEKIEKLKK